jgi:hypothetical protein
MITKEQAIKLSNAYNKSKHPDNNCDVIGFCETSTAFFVFYENWHFHMNQVNKMTGEVIPDDHLLHLNDKEYMESKYTEI